MESAGHIPVLMEEILELLAPQQGEALADCTAGRGGHASEIGKRVGASGTVVLSDQQPERGVAGSVVRMVLGASGEVWVLLVAEDRMYDRAPGTVAVDPPSRRGSP
jgi:hypothetical protein